MVLEEFDPTVVVQNNITSIVNAGNSLKGYVFDNMTCDYNRLPDVCKGLIPKYDDIIMKYNLIIIVGVLAFVGTVFWGVMFYKWYKELKRKKDGN